MSKITERVETIASNIVSQQGCSIWDVEYVKEAGTFFLRLYIDKDGGVSINDCENISRAIDPLLDEEDIIPDSYVFEVCSAGADRVLKKDSDFIAFLESEVDVRLYKPVEGLKAFTGILKQRDSQSTCFTVGDTCYRIDNRIIAQVKLHVNF